MFTKLAMAIGAVAAVTACSGAAASRTSAPGAEPATLTAATDPASRTITATGQGRARGIPDLLTATLGVQTSGPDARTVLTTNSSEAAALIGRLQADGVAAADIKTVQLSLNPQYSNSAPDGSPRVTGYAATDTVSVSIRRLDRAGTILDDAAAAGGNDTVIQSLSYSVADEGPLVAAAHADAVRQAQSAAKAMADAAGVTLGAVHVVTDSTPPQVVPAFGAEAAVPAASAPVPVPVRAGTEEVTAEVTVSYDIA
jgi:uncharacterized protein YggE